MSQTLKYGTKQSSRNKSAWSISEVWFKEGHRGSNHFLMEAKPENMQSTNNEAKTHLLVHMRGGSIVQQKSHKKAI